MAKKARGRKTGHSMRKRGLISVFFRGMFLVLKYFLVVLWSILSFVVRALASASARVWRSAFGRMGQQELLAKQPKMPAQYVPMSVKEVVKGLFDDFEMRLLDKSLIITIAGRRGSGKSTLGFRILENVHARTGRPAFVLGVRQDVIPGWIVSVSGILEVKNGGVVLVDEGSVTFGSRYSMSKRNKELGDLMAVARHKDLTLILVTQSTTMIDRNVLNLCDALMLKEGSLLQERMERNVMKGFFLTANRKFKSLARDERIRYAYVIDDDFEGLVEVVLPAFWSNDVSKSRA